MRTDKRSWIALIAVNAVLLGVLGFYRSGIAAPPQSKSPFPNSTEQRLQIIEQLKETNRLLREQNNLLRGRLQVVVAGKG